jgi:hypothetical protein
MFYLTSDSYGLFGFTFYQLILVTLFLRKDERTLLSKRREWLCKNSRYISVMLGRLQHSQKYYMVQSSAVFRYYKIQSRNYLNVTKNIIIRSTKT